MVIERNSYTNSAITKEVSRIRVLLGDTDIEFEEPDLRDRSWRRCVCSGGADASRGVLDGGQAVTTPSESRGGE